MKRKIQLLLLICLAFPSFLTKVNSQEFLIRDETFTWEEAEDAYFGGNGFHWWSDFSKYPYNWVSPHNYYEGKIYYRYEVINQPTNKRFEPDGFRDLAVSGR
ncbi:MAG: hypothetical protein HC905_31540 [Bacteroidales bacterium]|nr:hypothetical protein [Bacteroidales bacterium]